ncbi:MAG: ABC transporter substrate-binding protein [Candidatus Rokuibacteriota bacterium]
MRTPNSVGVTLVLVALVVTAIVPATAQEPYRLGEVCFCTGPAAQFGEYCQQGLEMALEDLAKDGWIKGRKLEVIREDCQAQPKLAIAGLTKLTTLHKVPAFVTYGSSVVLALAPVAESSKVVLLNAMATSEKIRHAGDFTFSNIAGSEVEVVQDASFAVKTLHAKKIAILYVNNEFGLSGRTVFTQEAGKLGAAVPVAEAHDIGATDYRTQLTKIRAASPDLIFMYSHDKEIGYALKQAKQLGIATPWLVFSGANAPVTFEIAGPALEGVIMPQWPYDPVGGSSRMREFASRYQQKYGKFPLIYVATCYDGWRLLAEALKSGAATGPEIKDYLYKVKDYQGISGPISFDKDGVVVWPARFVVVKGGKLTPYGQ